MQSVDFSLRSFFPLMLSFVEGNLRNYTKWTKLPWQSSIKLEILKNSRVLLKEKVAHGGLSKWAFFAWFFIFNNFGVFLRKFISPNVIKCSEYKYEKCMPFIWTATWLAQSLVWNALRQSGTPCVWFPGSWPKLRVLK